MGPSAIADLRVRLPLCRRYLSIHLHRVPIEVSEPGAALSSEMRWIGGTAADGESELLGIWISVESRLADLENSFEELRQRGVENIRYVIGSDLSVEQATLCAVFPDATALPSIRLVGGRPSRVCPELLTLAKFQASRRPNRDPGPGGRWPFNFEQACGWSTLTPAVLTQLLVGDGLAAAMNRSLRKAVARHGRFGDEKAALSFGTAALARAERRLGTTRAVSDSRHPFEAPQPGLAELST